MQVFTAPATASTEEQTGVIGCLEDQNLVRIFLAQVLAGTGPLSVESSGCINAALGAFDLPKLMIAGVAGGEQAAMIGSLSASILASMCLNDDEWEGAAASLGLAPEDRQNLLCVLDALGGPEGFAQTLSAGDEASLGALAGTAVGCGVQIGGGSGG